MLHHSFNCLNNIIPVFGFAAIAEHTLDQALSRKYVNENDQSGSNNRQESVENRESDSGFRVKDTATQHQFCMFAIQYV